MIKAFFAKLAERIRTRDLSIRNQLMISLTVIIVPLVLMGIFTYNYYMGVMTGKLTESQIQLLNQMSRNVEQFLGNIDSTVRQIKYDGNIQSVLGYTAATAGQNEINTCNQAIKLMEKIIISSEDISSIYVGITDYNRRSFIVPVGFINSREASIYPWYKDMDNEAKGEFFVPTRLNENSIQKEYIFSFISPVIKLSNFKIVGHAVISYKEEALNDILNGDNGEKQEKLLLLDNDNRIFYSSDRNYQPDRARDRILDSGGFTGKSGYFSTGSGSGRMLVTYTILPDYGWKLVSEMPYAEFSRELYQANSIMLGIIILCIFVSVGMAILLYRGVTKPLKDLVIRMKYAGEGDFSTQEYSPGTRNEIEKIHGNFNKMAVRIAQLMENNSRILQQNKDAEFKALQAQISPHFLYNTLDAINWLALLNNQGEISEMVKNLSLFFRNTLSDGKQLVTIEEELKQIDVYIRIERFRYKNRFDVEYNLDKRLYKYLTLKFILQPFVENALIHGFAERSGQGRIFIQLYSEENTIYFEVIDDGTGMTEEQIKRIMKERSGGYGVLNVDERIRLKYGEDYGVSIKSEVGKGTTVTISIPKMEQSEEAES